MSTGLVPPNDLDAESTVLSACMLDSDAFNKVQSFLKPEHFYATGNQYIYQAICDLNAIGKPTDAVAVAGQLRETGHLQKSGGTPYLASLCDSTPAMRNIETHARTVVEKHARRLLITTCQQIATEGYSDKQTLSDYLLDAESKVFDVTRLRGDNTSKAVTLGDATIHEFESMRERAKNPEVLPGITTGFPSLDRKIGGWRRGAKYTLAARPGQGKSALLLNFAVAAAESGHGVIVLSLEMPREQLVQRIIAQMSNVRGEDMDRPHRLTSAQWRDITAAVERMTKLPIVVVDSSSQTAASIRAAVREGKRLLKRKINESIEIGLVAIDYIQIMTGEGKGTRENEVAAMSGANRALAKDENCAVLELSQLNRGVENREDKRPGMADLRESGSLEQDSFGIIMLYRDDYYKPTEAIPDGFAELLIRKIRQYGSTGVIKVKFDGPTTNFYEDPDLIQEIQDDFLVDNGSF